MRTKMSHKEEKGWMGSDVKEGKDKEWGAATNLGVKDRRNEYKEVQYLDLFNMLLSNQTKIARRWWWKS